jgi:hypothetical protein
MNMPTNPCTLVRVVKVLDHLLDKKVLVQDTINGETFNASMSDIKRFTYQGETLLLVAGDIQ